MNNKQILQDAPKGATHWDKLQYYRIRFNDSSLNVAWDVFNQGSGKWNSVGDMYLTDVYKIRSLADIRELESLREQLETERLRLAACGVVANANTQETAKQAREMHDNYKSGSMDDVIRAVDSEMELRTRLATAKADGIREFSRHLFHKAQEVPLGLENKSKGASVYNWLTTISRDARHYANQLNKGGVINKQKLYVGDSMDSMNPVPQIEKAAVKGFVEFCKSQETVSGIDKLLIHGLWVKFKKQNPEIMEGEK